MKNEYMQHLLTSMEESMETVNRQMGKSDIEPPDYAEQIKEWHSSLCEKIREKEPEYYVKSINIYEKGVFDIDSIEYIYFEKDSQIHTTSINLLDVEDEVQQP